MSTSHADLDRFRSDAFEPLNFHDRGATVPFTTPLLLNARIRATHSGRGPEIVIINPSGGRGAMVLPWTAVPEICSPTLFDRQLCEKLATAEDISPIGIRHEAQRLAAQGLAGRRAAIAAQDALRREQANHQLMTSMLVDSLIASTDPTRTEPPAFIKAQERLMAKPAERALATGAFMAGMPLADFVNDLDTLALTLSGAHPETAGTDARLRRMLQGLSKMADGIAVWTENADKEASHVSPAKFVQQTARQTIECAKLALSLAEAIVGDLGRLLPHWKAERDKVLERARAPDWILDGWRTPMALWESVSPDDRQAAIWELALIAPILPREAKMWMSNLAERGETPRRVSHLVLDKADWRNGNVLDLVARNENLIGLAISYENQVKPMRLKHGANRIVAIGFGKTGKPTNASTTGGNTADGAGEKAEKQGGATETRQAGPLDQLRVLGEVLISLQDTKLLKIVSIVDQLSHPQIRSQLLGPSLPRLKQLRPSRPASLKRLLFLPLAGALTDPLGWRREEGRIPRSAVAPLLEALQEARKPELDALARQMRNAKLEDPKLVHEAGRELWRVAAEASPGLKPGKSWPHAGLNEEDFDAVISLAGGLWRHAGPLWDCMQLISGDCPPEILHSALAGPANEGGNVLVAALETLLHRATRPSVFASLLRDKHWRNAGLVEDVLNQWVGSILAGLADEDLDTAVNLAEGLRAVLEALEAMPRAASRVSADVLVSHRRNLDQFCRMAYREIVTVHITQGLVELKPAAVDALSEIEAMARTARRLEDIGRRVGSPQTYLSLQKDFHGSIERLQREDTLEGLSATELARIEEILIGQEAAALFLRRSGNQYAQH